MQQIKQYLLYPEGGFPSTTGWTGSVFRGFYRNRGPAQKPKSYCVCCPTPNKCTPVSEERNNRTGCACGPGACLFSSSPCCLQSSPCHRDLLRNQYNYRESFFFLLSSLHLSKEKKLYFYYLNNECQTFSHLFQNCCTGKVLEPSQPQPLGSYPREMRNVSHRASLCSLTIPTPIKETIKQATKSGMYKLLNIDSNILIWLADMYPLQHSSFYYQKAALVDKSRDCESFDLQFLYARHLQRCSSLEG